MCFNINSHRLHQRDASRRRRRRMERTNALLTMRNYFKLDLNINWEKFSVTKSCRSGREFTGKVCKFLAFFGSGKAAPERQNAAEQRHGACHKPHRNDLPSLRRTIILDNISCLMKASQSKIFNHRRSSGGAGATVSMFKSANEDEHARAKASGAWHNHCWIPNE